MQNIEDASLKQKCSVLYEKSCKFDLNKIQNIEDEIKVKLFRLSLKYPIIIKVKI